MVTNYFANTEGPFQKAAQAEQGRRGSHYMEIEDDPELLALEKKGKVMQGMHSLLGQYVQIAAYDMQGIPKEMLPKVRLYQNSLLDKAMGGMPQQQKEVPKSNVDVDDEMEMDDDGNEEESADASPAPSGAAPPNDTDGMITVDIWLKENNHDVTKKQAQRVGNITSDRIKKKFPNELRYKKSVDSTGYEHRHYPRSQACVIEEAYKIMMEEDEKAARQPAPAPAPAQRPPSATQDDVNKMFRGGRGQ